MNTKKLKEFIKIFEQSSLSELSVSRFGCRVDMKKPGAQLAAAPAFMPAPAIEKPEHSGESKVIDFSELTEIKSPMVGVFYRAASPGAKAFTEKGKRIKKGDIICIIEAMKVMNEITSDYDGEVVDITVSDGDIVEYSQVMFKIKQV